MHSYITSELARLHGEDLRRDAERHRRGREIRRRRPSAVVAWVRSVLSHRSGMPTALPVVPTVLSYPRTAVPVIPVYSGPWREVSPLLDVVEVSPRQVVQPRTTVEVPRPRTTVEVPRQRTSVEVPRPGKVIDLVNLGDLPSVTDVADLADGVESRCEC